MKVLVALFLLIQDQSLESLLQDLRSDSIETREKAAQNLVKTGAAAIPLLKKGLQHRDAEMARRCGAILEAIQSEMTRDAFKKLEDGILGSKTLRVRFKVEILGANGRSSVHSGLLLIKDGNRLSLDGTMGSEDEPLTYSILSDGLQYIYRNESLVEDTVEKAPDTLKQETGMILSRVGAAMVHQWFGDLREIPRKAADVVLISEFKETPEPGPGKSLSYSLDIRGRLSATGRATLWYDPVSSRLLKRIVKLKQAGRTEGITATETYDEFALTPELPDALFQRPKPDVKEAVPRAKSQLAQLCQSLSQYKADTGKFPERLDSLLSKPKGVESWKGPYLKSDTLLRDPWGRPFVYRLPGLKNTSGYDLNSLGPDGRVGSADDIDP